MLPGVVEAGTFLFGQVAGMIAQNSANKHKHTEMMLDKLSGQEKAYENARKFSIAAPAVQITKRFIAVTLTLAVVSPIWGPLLGAFLDFPVSVVHGYTEFHPGFLFLPDQEVVTWHEVTSGDPKAVPIVISPAMQSSFLAIIGSYFGASISRR